MMNLGNGYRYYPEFLDRSSQTELVGIIRSIVLKAPLFAPAMPRSGKPMSVRMSNCGPLGWVADRSRGYRYQKHHPDTGREWPQMPSMMQLIWKQTTGYPVKPEACLINYYGPKARMGLHRDQDEEDFKAPILSISLGDDALFRMGGRSRQDPTRSIRLRSGDLMIMSGPSRLFYHGIDRIYPGTSSLLDEGGRFNLTLRRIHSQSDSSC